MGKENTMNSNKEIKVMIFEPGKESYTAVLEDSLEHRQALVGGEIECISLPHETVLCCNAVGKWMELPANRQLGNDTLHGTFFLYGDTPEGHGVLLTEEQIAYFRDCFTEPRPSAVAFEVRSAKDTEEFLRWMFRDSSLCGEDETERTGEEERALFQQEL